jgi:hypothetical protein
VSTLVRLERRAREIEERRAVVLERLRGQRLERLAQPRVGLVEQLLRRSERRLLTVDLVPQPLVVLPDGGQFRRHRDLRFGELSRRDGACEERSEGRRRRRRQYNRDQGLHPE